MTSNVDTPLNFLLVDDDEVDIRGLTRAFARSRIANPVTVAHDGIEALEYLRGENGRMKLPRPHLVLLDINMPRMNGFEFLAAVRSDDDLRTMVVFMITTSKAEEDIARAYGNHVAGYILKQDLNNNFMHAVSLLEHYLALVQLPR